jgi:IS30 family transposase
MKILMDLFATTSQKHSAFTTITHEDMREVMEKLNNRPRKCLGFKTSNEVYKSYLIALAS